MGGKNTKPLPKKEVLALCEETYFDAGTVQRMHGAFKVGEGMRRRRTAGEVGVVWCGVEIAPSSAAPTLRWGNAPGAVHRRARAP